MRMITVFALGAVLFGNLLSECRGGGVRRSGGGNATAGTGQSRQSRSFAASPDEVLEAMRASFAGEGLELVSRADSGDYFRAVLPAYVLSADPELAHAARYGDIIIEARVGPRRAEVRTRFAQLGASAGYTLDVTPSGGGSLVEVTPLEEEGSTREARRIARNLGTVMSRHAQETLSGLDVGKRG